MVWFDERELEAGAEFESRIADQIAKSVLFIAVISRHWLADRRRFIRFEWREAESQAKFAGFNVPYVIPVAIDDTSPSDAGLPAMLRRLTWKTAPGGELTAAFVNDLVLSYRATQRAASSLR
jgi:hypothetical protein